MTNALESMLNEFHEEAATTRRVLDRVPEDKLTWKPHPKSMSLGQLADHIAKMPGNLAKMTKLDLFDAS
jgi:DNA topoisomerase VI subunit B